MNYLNELLSAFSKFFKTDKSTSKSNHSKRRKGTQEYSRKKSNIKNKVQGMKDSQGNSGFSGSSYNGPGNVDHEKINSNMSQRNF